MRLLCVQRYIK